MSVAGVVALIVALVAVIVVVLLAAWINPLLFFAIVLGVALGTAVRAVLSWKQRRAGHAADRQVARPAHPWGVIVGIGAAAFAAIIAVVSLFVAGGEYSIVEPTEVEQVQFELVATLQESDGNRSWDLETTLILDSDNMDRLLEAMDYPKAAPFTDLPDAEQEVARLELFQQLAAAGFAVSPQDFDESITVSQRTTRQIPNAGWMPGDWLVSETLAVPPVSVAGVVLEPNAGSVIRIASACNAFMRVSPSGNATCNNDDEERTIPLDQPGSTERSSVTGSVVPEALRYASPLVNFSLKTSASASVAFLLGVIPAVFGDRIKKWVAALFDSKPAASKLKLFISPARKIEDGDAWTVVLESVGWPPGELVTVHGCGVREGRRTEWNQLGLANAGPSGAVRGQYDVRCPDGEGQRFKITSSDHESGEVGFGQTPDE